MKKIVLTAIIALMMAFCAVACSAKDSSDSNNGQSSTDNPQKEETAGQESEQNITEDTVTEDTVTEDTVTEDATAGDINTVSILNDVWTTYSEDEKFYAMGGDVTNPVDNAPGLYSLEDADALKATLLVSADAKGMIDEAASLIHGMNTNNFTTAAFHLTNPANTEAFAQDMIDSIKNNQWMCGSPDQYVIYSVKDEYVVTAFGTMDIMKVFKEKFLSVHGEDAKVLVEENVAW